MYSFTIEGKKHFYGDLEPTIAHPPFSIQAAAQSSNLSEDKEAAHQDAATRMVFRSGPDGAQQSDPASEVARFGAIKEKKHSLEAGIAIFNR